MPTRRYVPHTPPLSAAPLRLGPRLALYCQDPPSCGLKPCWSRGPLKTHGAEAQAGRL